MLVTDHLPALLLAATTLLVLQRLVSIVLRDKDQTKPKIWAKVDSIAITSSGGLFSWARAIATSVISTRKFAAEGYSKFSKALNRPFALPTTWTGSWWGGSLVVVPPSLLHQMMTRPDKLQDSEITNIFGLIETIQLSYLIGDPDIYMNALHFDVVRRKMTRKDMDPFAADTAEEVDMAFREIWGTSDQWKTVNGWDMCGRIIARVAERMMVGLPLGRDEKLLDASRLYANSALLGGALMNCFPPIVRRVVGPVIALPARYYQTRCVKILIPVIEERIRIFRQGLEGDGVPDDFLQWLVATCAKDGMHQLDAPRIANRLIALMTPLIFAVCYMFAHSVLDLYGSPCRDEFLAGLEAECKRVSARHDAGLSTADAVDALHRIDSTIRESMRVSDVAVVNLHRDVTTGQVDIGNGVTITQGVRMTFPTQNIHTDPENYEDPRRFDAFRFSRKFEGMDASDKQQQQHKAAQERETLATPTLSWLAFGYGRHACPGRWYAAQTMKQALAYIIMNYDIELTGKPVKRKAMLNTMVPPVDAQMRIRRKS